ncbi:hypothetical protein HPB47_003358 [Ixodes persulcatus]|uniref:Uncharacterized protein n=1 Tax=Ixodes persulcatus TaxID=34615 RepID=A0AC60PJT8_IXOPE|nr:hypothetical protein HPB47_003358 [Ixodes persulcatus]
MNTEQRQITVVQSAALPPPPLFLADRILRDCVGRQVPTLERAIQLALQFEQLTRTAEQYHQPRQGEPRRRARRRAWKTGEEEKEGESSGTYAGARATSAERP